MKQGTLFKYLLRLGDTALINTQRLSEWTGHGPFLEEDLALTNIALDNLGRANALLNYAGTVEGKGRTEDDLAFHRDERDFYNILLVELPNGDYANTLTKQFLLSAYEEILYRKLSTSADPVLAGIAKKSVKELTYHVRHTSSWLKRFGNGTDESRAKAQTSLNELWRYTGELFEQNDVDAELIQKNIATELHTIKSEWEKVVLEAITECGLEVPSNAFMQRGSREGKHTEHLGFMLAEMQFLPRAYPDAKW